METIPQSSTIPPIPSTSDDKPPKTLVDHPEADITFRSCDSQEFRVPKLYMIDSSPVLAKLIQATSDPSPLTISSSPDNETTLPLPVVQLSINSGLLSALLTFIFHMVPDLPPTPEGKMELLSVAQKYEMVSVLARIRGCIALQDPPLICAENAFHAYSLAWKYGLRQEAAQAAKFTLTFTLDLEYLELMPDVPQGVYFHELWKYHQSVQSNLLSNVEHFKGSAAGGTLTDLLCVSLNQWRIPEWLDGYLISVAKTPSRYDCMVFHAALASHVGATRCFACRLIRPRTMHAIWTALTIFVNENMVKASVINMNLSHLVTSTYSHRPSHHSLSRSWGVKHILKVL